MAILTTYNLGKVFNVGAAEVIALRGVQIEVQPGEFVAIVGPLGSGKSTLLHLLGGLDTPTQGEVHLEGRPFGSLDDQQRSQVRRRRIGFVFQKINLLPTLSAEENVALPLLIDGIAHSRAIQQAQAALQTVAMEHRATHLPGALSGGEQQRVAVARALVIDPAVILADEPTGSLDRVNGQRILELLRTNIGGRRTVIVVTHDLEVAAQADRRIVLRDGQLQSDSEVFPPAAPLAEEACNS